MSRKSLSKFTLFFTLLSLGVVFLVPASSKTSLGKESEPRRKIADTTFTWLPYYSYDNSIKPNIPFYVGGRFMGFGRNGFKAAIEKFRQLPRGTSVVWGPDCGKMSSGPDNSVLANRLFPELWKDFQQVAKERGIILSSNTWPFAAEADEPPELPAAEYVEPGTPVKKEGIVLDWKPEKGNRVSIFDYRNARAWPVYYLNGSESGRGRGGFLATLKSLRESPVGSRLRIVWHKTGNSYYNLPGIRLFDIEFRELVAEKKFRLVFECPKDRRPKQANCPARCRFTWRNFRSLTTPHKEVVYLVDGKVMGMGNAGFSNALKELRRLPRGAHLEYPRYGLHHETPRKKREAFYAKDSVPFTSRGVEFMDVVKERNLVVDRYWIRYWPKTTYNPTGRFEEEQEGDCFLESLLRFAVIIRDGAKPSKADAVVSWKQERGNRRTPISEATYLYNGEKIGVGTSGFIAILKRLKSLNDGATVRIDPVCIRTRGPFSDAVIIKGQRHFETSGEEPFRGMVDLLAELARQKRLRVEVIPDEGKPNHSPGGK